MLVAAIDLEQASWVFAGVCALVVLAFMVWAQKGLAWSDVLCKRYLYSGRRVACRRAIAALRFAPHPLAPLLADRFLIRLASDEACTVSALAGLDRLIAQSTAPQTSAIISASLVDIWVNAGHYRAAIFAPRQYRWRGLGASSWELYSVAHINRAEALHNVGRNDLALRLLARIRSRNTSGVGVNGSIALEAWILADMGRAREAREVFERIDPRPLTPYYAAEVHFTRALIELASGEYEVALAEASSGMANVVRASSERNGWFLLGRIEALRGNLEPALALYERGRSHRYRGQSGRGLLELGQLYERSAQPDAARAAYAQAIREDPENAATARCRVALDESLESVPQSEADVAACRAAQ